MTNRLVVRRSDATVWRPSTRPGYDAGQALADLLSGDASWYFVRVHWKPAPWWRFWSRGKWTESLETWEPVDGSTFRVIDAADLRRIEDFVSAWQQSQHYYPLHELVRALETGGIGPWGRR